MDLSKKQVYELYSAVIAFMLLAWLFDTPTSITRHSPLAMCTDAFLVGIPSAIAGFRNKEVSKIITLLFLICITMGFIWGIKRGFN